MAGGIVSRAATNRLTDKAIRAYVLRRHRGEPAPRRLADGGGLSLTVTPAGRPVWHLKFRHAGKEQLLSAGPYPEVSLEQARQARDEARALLREGRNPALERKKAKLVARASASRTFEPVARDWLERERKSWSAIHYAKSKRALERDVFPVLGSFPVAEISKEMVAAVVDRIMERGVRDTAAKVLQHLSAIFDYALLDPNPAAGVEARLPRRPHVVHRAALLDIEALREVLRRADAAPLSPSVRMAQRLVAFSAQRLGNVITAKWEEFDLDAQPARWTIPRGRLKVRDRSFDHTVILGETIAAELKAWRETTGGEGYVFPSPTGRAHVTLEAMSKAYKQTLGLRGKHTLHGWRSSFASLARDEGFSADAVAVVLDHVKSEAKRKEYDRGERLQERRRLAEWWNQALTGGI